MIIQFLAKRLRQLGLFSFGLTLIFYSLSAQTKPAKKWPRSFAQIISAHMNLIGDLNESYQFDGLVGDHLTGVPQNPTSSCEAHSTFNSVLYKEKKMLEVWVDLACTIQGQKMNLKPHRFFIENKADLQSINWPVFDEKIKKLTVQIQDLTIKTPKVK